MVEEELTATDRITELLNMIKILKAVEEELRLEMAASKDEKVIKGISARLVANRLEINSKKETMFKAISLRDTVCLLCLNNGIFRSATTRKDDAKFPICVSHHHKAQMAKDKTGSLGQGQCSFCNTRFNIGTVHKCDSVKY